MKANGLGKWSKEGRDISHWSHEDYINAKEELVAVNADKTLAKDMNLPDEVKQRLKAQRRKTK